MERLVLREVVETVCLDDFVGTAIEMIERLNTMRANYGDNISLELSDGSYSGYYSVDICRSRLQTDEEYAVMVANNEVKIQEENSVRARRIVDKVLSGKKVTAKERRFMSDIGISIP